MKSKATTRAFTLIELLVVVSIIALLVSILLPALSAAREASKNVVCKANLRQISMGLEMYLDAYEGRLPTNYNTYEQVAYEYLKWTPPWYVALGQMIGWSQDGLAQVELKQKNVIHCPSTPVGDGDMADADNWGTAHYGHSQMLKNLRISQIRPPYEYVFLSDSRPAYFTFNPYLIFPVLKWDTELIVPRHRDHVNELYFDLHIEDISEEELYLRGIDPYIPVSKPPETPR